MSDTDVNTTAQSCNGEHNIDGNNSEKFGIVAPEVNNAAEDEERKHFCRIVSAFKAYKGQTLEKIVDKQRFIHSMPLSYQDDLSSYVKHLNEEKNCVIHNAEVINLIIKDIENMFENVQHELNCFIEISPETKMADLEKVQSILKHIVRDWSKNGKEERDLSYKPIINKVESLFPLDKVQPSNVHILVPGAGLGRLSYEFARRGYTCQGNEYSLFMLFTSNFILNRLKGINSLHIYPWCHSGCNVWSNADQLRQISFPDVEPSNIPNNTQFTMAAGDFLEIYHENDSWDVVATCFFIDCANNILSFIRTIYNILKPGGYWINLGPLLYHFADITGEKSIEPTYEVLRQLIISTGFKILDEQHRVRTTYTQNKFSMLNYDYNSVFFTAQKP